MASWPVFVVGDDPEGLAFSIAVDDVTHIGLDATHCDFVVNEDETTGRRQPTHGAPRAPKLNALERDLLKLVSQQMDFLDVPDLSWDPDAALG